MQMRENFEIATKWMLAHEGGYVNHPKDPGGATNLGVIQRTYDHYRRRKGLATRSVRAITADEVAEIYKSQYWDAVRGDELPSGVDYAVYDFAVNSGPKRALEELQRVVGAKVDGIVGMETVGLTNAADPFAVIEALCNRRIAFMKRIKHRQTGALLWKTFGRGWQARVDGVLSGAITLARGSKAEAENLPDPVSSEGGKAIESERESITESTTLQATLLQGGSALGGIWGAVTQLDGMDRSIALAFIGIIILSTLWIARERVKKWAEGDR